MCIRDSNTTLHSLPLTTCPPSGPLQLLDQPLYLLHTEATWTGGKDEAHCSHPRLHTGVDILGSGQPTDLNNGSLQVPHIPAGADPTLTHYEPVLGKGLFEPQSSVQVHLKGAEITIVYSDDGLFNRERLFQLPLPMDLRQHLQVEPAGGSRQLPVPVPVQEGQNEKNC